MSYLKRNFISLNGLWHFPISYMYSETRMVLRYINTKLELHQPLFYLHFVIAFESYSKFSQPRVCTG